MEIFDKIIVRQLDAAKVRLQFVFKNLSSPSYMGEVANCMSSGLVEQGNLYAELVLNPQFSIISNAYITSPSIPERALKQKYVENCLSMREIAREFSCSKTHVRNQLLKYKIPLRAPLHPGKDRWCTYGKRKVNGRTIDHKGELRAIATIKEMYGEGIKPTSIARFLDAMKIPTKQQGKGWHHHTVITILKREGLYVTKNKPRRRKWTLSSVSS